MKYKRLGLVLMVVLFSVSLVDAIAQDPPCVLDEGFWQDEAGNVINFANEGDEVSLVVLGDNCAEETINF